jgi:hypothetical protein
MYYFIINVLNALQYYGTALLSPHVYAEITFYSLLFVSVKCALAEVGLTVVGVFTT